MKYRVEGYLLLLIFAVVAAALGWFGILLKVARDHRRLPEGHRDRLTHGEIFALVMVSMVVVAGSFWTVRFLLRVLIDLHYF